MNRSPSPEPQPAKDYSYLKPLGVNDYSARLSVSVFLIFCCTSSSNYFWPESEERERLKEIEDTKRAVKERAEENEANRIAQAELGRQGEEKKAADYDHRAVTKRVTKVLRKTSIFEPKYGAETGEGSSRGSGKEFGRGNAKK
ncbi:hypothetical protein BCON_0218g00160 [Botryotinia convoluta]|uniref:Uncharacterized protein n=1 Tax=Botryotinia convoluta TaxID=54673 RepID=A0A4Z1HK34_9HELO|nr:hypothetical protein BCON_0218g00160 [Botryotinia convoluta]